MIGYAESGACDSNIHGVSDYWCRRKELNLVTPQQHAPEAVLHELRLHYLLPVRLSLGLYKAMSSRSIS